MELVRFDMQKMETPEIAGVVYQQGTRAGCEVRAYPLEKWGRRCGCCDARNLSLQIEFARERVAVAACDEVAVL